MNKEEICFTIKPSETNYDDLYFYLVKYKEKIGQGNICL